MEIFHTFYTRIESAHSVHTSHESVFVDKIDSISKHELQSEGIDLKTSVDGQSNSCDQIGNGLDFF